MTSILFWIVRICASQFKRNYFKKEKVSSIFVLFLEFTSNLENFEEEDDLHSCCISEITDCERLR